MLLDTKLYSIEDIVLKESAATMLRAIESLVLFFIQRIFNLIWTLPMREKLNKCHDKLVLRQILYQHIPKELIEKDKAGFSKPLDEWLRTFLFGWINNLLNKKRLEQDLILECEGLLIFSKLRLEESY